jgi:hypothetical protein
MKQNSALTSFALTLSLALPNLANADEKQSVVRPVFKSTLRIEREMLNMSNTGKSFVSFTTRKSSSRQMIHQDRIQTETSVTEAHYDSEFQMITSKTGYVRDLMNKTEIRVLIQTDLKSRFVITKSEMARLQKSDFEALLNKAAAEYTEKTGLAGKVSLENSDLVCTIVDRSMACDETIQITVK